MIFASIRHNLANLLRFSGRDSRRTFWPYAIAVVLLDIAAMTAAMLPIMAESFGRMQRFAVEHPEQATVDSGPGHYSITIHGNHPELMPDVTPIFTTIALIVAATILLLGAAVARRLHDRQLRGAWGLIPLPFLGFASVAMPRLFASMRTGNPPDMRLFAAMFVNNALYLAALATLVVLLVGAGTNGPNRYGETTA
jgi:uncharacterized membrane protein YhaH (DUF805 family)